MHCLINSGMMLLSILLILTFVGLPANGQHATNCLPGRHAIVHLFEWRWIDIADECERYLGPKGFCGVQISPPNEHRIIPEHREDGIFDRYHPVTRPWYERYQPVSYKLTSRSGNEDQLKDMIKRCNNVGVRIYVDAVINHMAGAGAYGTGSSGSIWNSATLNFPAVPYTPLDFHPECDINNYGDEYQVRNCRLVGLVDLDLGREYVRNKTAEFMNKLSSFGVAGFRIDASKHVHPNDLLAIRNKLDDLDTAYFQEGSKPFIFQEVIDMGGESISANEYVGVGRVTEFKYGKELARLFRNELQLKNIATLGEAWQMVHSNNAVVFVDNHDNQRGHGGGGNIITFRDPRLYKMANAFMLAWPYGFTRIMSSYDWPQKWENGKDKNDWIGPPADGNRVQNTKPVIIKRDGTCDNDWICEHRWRQISNMVTFRNVVTGTDVNNWWDNMANQIAFSRGNMGFLAINNDDSCMATEVQSGLPSGTYCDVITGYVRDRYCSGRMVRVMEDGKVFVDIPSWLDDPIVAIHAGTRISSSPSHGLVEKPEDFQRTVIFLKKQTSFGQDIFFRGGIDHGRRAVCKQNASMCAIPIKFRNVGSGDHYRKFNDWCVGDKALDWGSTESGQGSSDGEPPAGTPVVWTTNTTGNPAYQSLNTFGDHYWMLDADFDCSKTIDGWFELKAVIRTSGQTELSWEPNINYANPQVRGTAGETLPFCSSNHIVKCGKVNILQYGSQNIQINNF